MLFMHACPEVLMAAKKKRQIIFDCETGVYTDSFIARGLPLGGIGSGGITIGSDGSFMEARCNNNWMNPVRNLKGSFFAVHTMQGTVKKSRILRRGYEKEFGNIDGIASTRFKGILPEFELGFNDSLPVEIKLSGFTPHIPHNIKDSTIPAALFSVRIRNISDEPVFISVLFSWQNILGCGGTGQTGLVMRRKRVPVGLRGRLTYRDVNGNYQDAGDADGMPAILFRTKQSYDPRSHRYGVLGEYLLAACPPEGFTADICEGYDAAELSPAMIDSFVRSGRISLPSIPVIGSDKIRSAGAVAVYGSLAPGESVDVPFYFIWWTPGHVTEKDSVANVKTRVHDGVRVGHVYENYFSSASDVAGYLRTERERLYSESMELPALLDESNLPVWLKRSIRNSIDSVLCNTVVPKDGRLYTIEGMDWQWPYGGLTGTNDQRLSSHPYTSVFFTELDRSELDTFRRLTDERGSVPHGNGNCDLALGDASIPYGWPEEILFVLAAKEWTDLAASEIIQAGKMYRMTGDRQWLDVFWSDLKRMAEFLDINCIHGVPEGGTTYDIWHFPGTFIYSATVYLAALKTMTDLAGCVESGLVPLYEKRAAVCKRRMDEALWDEKAGYFRSSPDRSTMFCAALAGDWVNRYSGLGPVLEPERAQMHMGLCHKLLIEGAKNLPRFRDKLAKPVAEMTLSGREKLTPRGFSDGDIRQIYIWQVISYQACEHIYLGQVEKGLDTLYMVYSRLESLGYTFSADLTGETKSIYMTHPVAWAILNAFTGAALDVPKGVLRLGPRMLPGEDRLKCPVFFPGFWAMLDYDVKKGFATIDVRKHYGKPVMIKSVIFDQASGGSKEIPLEKPALLEQGNTITIKLAS
jgi:non-lysosomal glucosylceramidase